MNSKLKKYTIVGFDETEGESITDTVEALGPDEAMLLFAEDRAFPTSTVIVDIFEGELISAMPTSLMNATVYCSELEKENEMEEKNLNSHIAE